MTFRRPQPYIGIADVAEAQPHPLTLIPAPHRSASAMRYILRSVPTLPSGLVRPPRG